MPLRRRRPVARLATTAVVAGTAAHMGAKRGAAKATEAQAEAAPPPPETYAPETYAPAPAPQPAGNPDIEQITQLAALRDQGILTEEEFAAKKAQILGI